MRLRLSCRGGKNEGSQKLPKMGAVMESTTPDQPKQRSVSGLTIECNSGQHQRLIAGHGTKEPHQKWRRRKCLG